MILNDVSEGLHTIRVDVDNTFGSHSSLHIPNDYYTYGGITRPAGLEFIHGIYIKNIHFTPGFQDGAWRGRITAEICNIGKSDRACDIKITLAGKEFNTKADISSESCFTAVGRKYLRMLLRGALKLLSFTT